MKVMFQVIIKHNCKQLISTVPFFEKGKDEGNFVDDVLSRLSFEMAMPNDDIIKANTRADKMYFIQEGKKPPFLNNRVGLQITFRV